MSVTCSPPTVDSCFDSCLETQKQCFYTQYLFSCLQNATVRAHDVIQQTAEAVGFVKDKTSQNQIEAIFMLLDDTTCGVGLNSDFVGVIDAQYANFPAHLVQNVKAGMVCTRSLSVSLSLSHTHTHTRTHTYDTSSIALQRTMVKHI